jgi:sporulation protein YlmC with PRC-barrel domain
MPFRDERGKRDQAGVGPDPDYAASELMRMRELSDFRLSPGEPDIRGWEVCTLTGQRIGRVDELIIDPQRGQVVLLDVDMRDEAGHREVPIRAVQIDRARSRVIVDRADMSGAEMPIRRTYDDQLRRDDRDALNRDLLDDDDRIR